MHQPRDGVSVSSVMTTIVPPIGRPLVRGIGILSVVAGMLVAGGLFWLAMRGASDRWPAVLVAGVVCWLAAVGGLVISALASQSSSPLAGILGGMFVRFGLPLGVGVVLTQSAHPLAAQGVFGFILVFYLTLLPIETWLSLPFAQSAKGAAKQQS